MKHELIGKRRDALHSTSINVCMPFFWAFRSHKCLFRSVNCFLGEKDKVRGQLGDFAKSLHVSSGFFGERY